MNKPDDMTRAIDALCDLGLTPGEAVERFIRIAKNMNAGTRSFALHLGGYGRVARMNNAYDEAQSLRWADDGGRVP